MSYIQREINRIAVALAANPEQSDLNAALHALCWVLRPDAMQSPYEMIEAARERRAGDRPDAPGQ